MAETPTIQDVFGGTLIEIALSMILYGITLTQTYVYYLNYPDDSLWLKLHIAAVTVVETIHTIFIIHMSYAYLITDFGHLEELERIVWSAGGSATLGMVIVALVQGFYIRRIWILSGKNKPLTFTIAALAFVRVVFGLATSTLTLLLGTWDTFRSHKGPLFTLATGLSLSALVDLLIAVTLMYYLHRSRTGLKHTDHLIRSLMAYIVNTGAITMIVSIAIVLTFVFLKGSLLFAGLVQMSSKLYANSLLGTLNARNLLRRKADMMKVELVERFQSSTIYRSNPSDVDDSQPVDGRQKKRASVLPA
ncbi:hypothetical protein K474DRAFT_1662308 [Panus rudis PR-1116 ss-1]|nr:hypothetical protein K474DRAFT_1662308 [Panus rudis PR-1116 ss-1]